MPWWWHPAAIPPCRPSCRGRTACQDIPRRGQAVRPMPAFLQGANSLTSAWDVLAGQTCPGQNVVIVGGGLVGCETADFLLPPIQDLAPRSRRVALLEQGDTVGAEERSAFRPLMVQRLLQKGCKIHTGARVVSVEGDTVQYEQDGSLHTITGVDTVVSAVGTRPENGLAAGLKALGIPTWVIGDAAGSGTILAATREGWETAQTAQAPAPGPPPLR